ncbi:MAG: Asp-tRNA(Asn)/Glu-tRNA(Gln) amidotransferase subunit GatB, partial [Candidatus Pacebacteria bacterium]|nr:Asp-tRNA(Asn)/Glu-tRNA(Gln) amidotransferase subunit GatB [Candidatus Paceibacterota bacterium]
EIHAELKTRTKMFCDCKNDTDETRPNVNICPVCTAQPGTLPVINKQAVKNVLKVGLALGGQLADFTEFDRKNYFYPDIPKGYQISQYKYPLVSGGKLNKVEITRVHLEEDTAKSTHNGDYSLLDFNRAGVPLMELVTEPMIENARQAGDFAREFQLLLRYLGVSEANMEKGEMRVEANISVTETAELGTKIEIKNLNSFRVVEKAIDYEIKRQIEVLEDGGKIIQETRGWNENSQSTFAQRIKEGSADYRYFPDPDLPKLKISEISEFQADELKKEIPELPREKRERYRADFGVKDEDIESFIRDKNLADFFEEVVKNFINDKETIKLASNYITSDLMGLMKLNSSENHLGKIVKDAFIQLIQLAKDKKISSRGAKDILAIMFEKGGSPEEIAKDKNLFQQSDEGELQKIIGQVIAENQAVVKEYKNGKETALKYLIGQGMKISRGSANPEKIGELLKKSM